MTLSILIGAVLANLLVAISNTFNKEKQMIREGGNPLPTSSYVFLIIKYLLWAGFLLMFLPLKVYVPDSLWEWTLFSMGVTIVAYIGATLAEVLFRVLVVYFVTASRKRKLAKELAE